MFAGTCAVVVRRHDRLRVARLDSIFRKTQQNRQRVLGAVQQRRRAAVPGQRAQPLARVDLRRQLVIAVPENVDALPEDVHTAAGRIARPSSTVAACPRLSTIGAQFRTLFRRKAYVALLLASVSADEIHFFLFFFHFITIILLFLYHLLSLRIMVLIRTFFFFIFYFLISSVYSRFSLSLFSSSLSYFYTLFGIALPRQWNLFRTPPFFFRPSSLIYNIIVFNWGWRYSSLVLKA